MPIKMKKSSMKYKDSSGTMQDVGLPIGGVETDATLTKSGVSADAKAVGDNFKQLSEQNSDLENRLETIEKNGVGSGGIAQETDPTVPDWAKQPNKPTYTASEVGALPDTTTIPTKVSQLTNDKNYLTSIPNDIANHKDDLSKHIVYGVCETAADVAEKTVTVDGNFVLQEGSIVIIKFLEANSIASPTLNVNGTGAKPMYRYGTTTISTATTTSGWIKGCVQMYTYDGTGWVRDYWNNTTYSNASLGCGYATCSTETATAAKTATLSSYSLTAGGIVAVKFSNSVLANATLNINSKGAKNIYYKGAKITDGIIRAGDVATFVYSSYYHLIAIDRWEDDIQTLAETKANKTSIPTKTSQLTNDSNFVTKSVTDALSGQIADQQTQVTTNKNNIEGMQKAIDDMTSLKAQGNTLEEQLLWLETNGDKTKEYLCVDGYYYACVYTEGAPLYTNQLPLAKDTDRSTIYNGKGYIDNYRLNSSGVLKDLSGCQASGFIPCKQGDVIRIKNLHPYTATSYNHVICFYNDSNAYLGSTYLQPPASGTIWASSGHAAGIVVSGDVIQVNTSSVSGISNCTAFRFMGTNMANVIVTVNQEIVEGTSAGSYVWENTGRSNASTNYENRISAIEKMIEEGTIGGSASIKSIVESTEDGGLNIITFADGSTLTIKNGSTGSRGLTGASGKNGTTQITPLFAESVAWLNSNGDTSKVYILPDNSVYAYINGKWTYTGNSFNSTDGSCQKYLADRSTYIAPVPSGYCESKVTYNTNGTHYLSKYDFSTMTGMFTALATANQNYVTETLLGKDSTDTYDIKYYVLDAPSSISDGYESAMHKEKPVFIITSGLHGVEPDAVHSVYHFMKDLCENHMESDYLEYLRNNVKFVIVPLSNPWGYVNQSYYNSNNVDLNKNFEHGYRTNGTENTGTGAYSEVETQYLKNVFDSYPNAVFHLECHGKYGEDTSFSQTIWFSLMRSLNSDLIEICAETITKQIGRRLYKLGYNTSKSIGGYITYYGMNGRPKDYTGTEYGMLSCTMEGSGKIYGTSGYSIDTQKVNCEALENFILRVLDSLNSRVDVF